MSVAKMLLILKGTEMKTIYLVQEVVDLGDHTVSAWFSEEQAELDCLKRTEVLNKKNHHTIGRETYWVDEVVISDSL